MNLNRKQLFGGLLLLSASSFACDPTGSAEAEIHVREVERHLSAMGTSLTLLIKADNRAEGLTQSELAVRAIETVEARLSTWRADSELSMVNAAPVQTSVHLSEALTQDLARVENLWRQTDGHFDPALGPLVQAWGLRGEGHVPSDGTLAAAVRDSGWRHFALTDNTLVRSNQGARIEEGGFGKGIALDAALAAIDIDLLDSFAVELGGQWIVHCKADDPFTMGIAHPTHRQESLLQLRLTTGSAATSGNSERGFVIDGEAVGHILSAKTGVPARDFGSMTVVAQDATTADCLSTALFVMGPDAALVWASQHEGVEIVVIERTASEPRVRATAGLETQLTSLSNELVIEFTPPHNVPIGQ